MKTESPAQRRRADRIAEARCKRLGIRSDVLDEHIPEKDGTPEVLQREEFCRRNLAFFDTLPIHIQNLVRAGEMSI